MNNQKLHIKVLDIEDQITNGVLSLNKKQKNFTVTIKECQDEIDVLKNELQRLSVFGTIPEKKLQEYQKQKAEIFKKYENVEWIWCVIGIKNPYYKHKHNKSFNKGLDSDGKKTFKFQDILRGRGFCYLEAFFPDVPQEVNIQQGLVVRADGTPQFIRSEWTDHWFNPIKEKDIKYGSEVILNIYTENLFGDVIQVKLFDERLGPDKMLNIGNRWSFERFVNVEDILPFEIGEIGVSDNLFDEEKIKNKESNQVIQKVSIAVKIDKYWADIIRVLLYNPDLDLIAKVFYNNEELEPTGKSKVLKIREKGELIDDPNQEITNQPVLVQDFQNSIEGNLKPLVDFTFGVFLDGTLNNMYNTQLRQFVTNKGVDEPTGLTLSLSEAKKVYKERSKYAKKDKIEDGDTSFENDLSNPAILFKNYEKDEKRKIFRVYTEGIGSNSAPEEQEGNLTAADYKKDDLYSGPAFGEGTAGITDRVRKAITDVVNYIQQTIEEDKYDLGTITFDVFGFSRGAAAARHFVHVVKHSAYKPDIGTRNNRQCYIDTFGYPINHLQSNNLMPEFGYLGELLDGLNLLNIRTKVNIRFVGIYDTVPHHGWVQWNDIKDLGLNDVNKAHYVVHMVADDEHRANFDLAPIDSVSYAHPLSGDKGGVELSFPGVHCDVGGAYVEGWEDNPKKIESAILPHFLEPLRNRLIQEGWFTEEQLFIKLDPIGVAILTKNYYRLEGKRKLSNQYSFIPLHLMMEIFNNMETIINEKKLIKTYNFKENKNLIPNKSNVAFLNQIKKILHQQTFENGPQLKFKEYAVYTEPAVSEKRFTFLIEDEDEKQELTQEQKQVRGQENLDKQVDKQNEDLKFLRNHYLHWNSSYSSVANVPNIVNGKRKRNHIKNK